MCYRSHESENKKGMLFYFFADADDSMLPVTWVFVNSISTRFCCQVKKIGEGVLMAKQVPEAWCPNQR